MTNERIEEFIDKYISLRESHNFQIDLRLAMTAAAFWTREKMKEELIGKTTLWLHEHQTDSEICTKDVDNLICDFERDSEEW